MNFLNHALLTIKTQIETFAVVNPILISSIIGYLVFRITRKLIHLVLTVVAIFVLYELFIAIVK